MYNYHPIVVHFPIALFTSAALLGIVGLFYRRGLFKEVLFWNLLIGFLATILSIYTGLQEEGLSMSNFRVVDLMTVHKRNAYIIAGFFFLLFAWMGLRKKEMKSFEYCVWCLLLLIGGMTVGYQTYNGTQLVYSHGTGIKPYEEIINLQMQKESQSKNEIDQFE